jgi:hypothetical protein
MLPSVDFGCGRAEALNIDTADVSVRRKLAIVQQRSILGAGRGAK